MRIRAVCAALATFSALLVGPSTVAAAAASEEGRLLAADYDPAPATFPFEWVTDNFFTFEPGPRSELRPAPWQVRSLTDGHVVDTTPNDPDVSFDSPRLAGDQVVTRTEVEGGSRLEFRGLAGAASLDPVIVPSGDTELLVHRRGVLVDRVAGSNHMMMVLRPGGEATAVSGAPAGFNVSVADTDGDVALIRDYTKLYVVDLATASATTVADVPPTTDWAALTPHRVVWRTGNSADGADYREHYAWQQRDGSAFGTVDTPLTYTQLTIGDDLAVLRVPHDGSYLRTDLIRVSLPGGSASAPLVSGVSSARALEDGRVLLTRDFDVSAVRAAGDVTKLADIARPVRGGNQLALAGQRVVSGADGGGGLRETTLTASAWNAVPGVPAGAASPFQLAGDVVYTEADRTLRWPGGQRTFPQYTSVVLGRGGRYAVVQTSGNFDTYSIQDVRTGAQVTTRSAVSKTVAVDGTWLWESPDSAGRLTGTDLVTKAVKTVTTPAHCPGNLDVMGRWALNECGPGENWVTDLLGVRGSFPLPDGQRRRNLVLGNGFVVDFSVAPGDPDVPELVVTDLNSPSHPQRTIGPVRGRFFPPGPTYAADRNGDRRIVYVDPESRVRAVDLTWLAPPPPTSTDTTAPVRATSGVGDRVRVSTAAVRFSYGYRDNVKVVSYDVGYRAAAAGRALGAWTFPAEWQRTTVTAVTRTIPAGTDGCFLVRGRDAAGNVSAWSPQSCTAMPQDDRSMTGSGSVSRLAFSSAYRGTVTRLNRSGASITKTGEYGRRIAVLALVGPGQGSVDVYHGTRRIGRVSLSAASWSRRTVYLPVTAYLSGSVRVVSVSSLPSSIDGIALLRS